MMGTSLSIGTHALDLLMPLHVRVSPTGHITGAGPTLHRIFGSGEVFGRRLLEVFEVRRPRNISIFSDLLPYEHCRLRVVLRDNPRYTMKGLFIRLPDEDGVLINLSLGISVVDAVSRFDLSSVDFAPSDPTVDMLYLIEAKSVALDESKRLNNRLHGAKTQAEAEASSDTLTGLKNRRAMDQMLGRLTMDHTPFGLMHLDLDYFKQVNDTLGHAAGDLVLRHVAEVLQDETRSQDLVARVGGDEFVLIFNDRVDIEILKGIAGRIIARLETPVEFEGQPCRISASIGTTLSTYYDAPDIDRMLMDADSALYASKEQGRACHTVFRPEMS